MKKSILLLPLLVAILGVVPDACGMRRAGDGIAKEADAQQIEFGAVVGTIYTYVHGCCQRCIDAVHQDKFLKRLYEWGHSIIQHDQEIEGMVHQIALSARVVVDIALARQVIRSIIKKNRGDSYMLIVFSGSAMSSQSHDVHAY